MPVRFRRVRGKLETPLLDELDEAKSSGGDAPEEAEVDDLAPADEADEATEEIEEDDAPDEDAPAPARASGSDLNVETALKELAARMTMLTSSMDGVKESKAEMEDKLSSVEERMMRLGALAEAVSSKYNPFISENSPAEPSWNPEGGPASAAEPSAPAAPLPPPPPEPEATNAPVARDPPEPATAAAPVAPASRSALEVTESARRLPGPGPLERAALPGPSPPSEDGDPLERNFLLLEWVGLLLARVGRAGLLDLLEYYEGLGWLHRDLKDRALKVAVGVDAPDRVGESGWRGDLDLHERSLVAIERLSGRPVSAARLESLRLDMRRMFGG